MTSPASLSQNTSAAPWQRAASGANLLSADGSLGVTIFEEMTTLAMSTGAINLGQGFPDEDGPAEIKAAAQAAITAGANQYAPGKGIPELREAIAAHQERFYGLTPDPQTEVVVTTGATEAIAAALLAFIEPGDEVLTFEPFYDSYGAIIGLAGAKHVTAPLLAPDFLPDVDAMESAFSERTKVVLLNNPHNPTGAVFPREVLVRVVELARKYDAVILSDEVYEHLTFGVQHLPVAGIPGAAERSVTISSAGKTFSFTGWKIGWLSGPAHLVAAIRTVKQFLSYSSGTPFQSAIAVGLALPDEFYSGIASTLQHKRDILAEGLRAAGFGVYTPQGTYFINVDTAPLGIRDSVDLARKLPELVGVAAIPVPVFCHPEGAERTRSLLRFAFCKKTEVLEEAAARLATLRNKL
ncbi:MULTISPECIES: aminotransferase class I/II-fold pyridoxal phosphate-dependent enzyme [Arthrobacter]|uniref:N-succinyldiaminopimelate aminotransferase n=1 Tax=Arthrobacter bambusae TaxID=1338426 RepID=A0AAW8DHK9_9MICC|nr:MULTISPECIES: aminotransferase class I/II-fold pyridoxal phosphate-dependent enzyme [Arthrobacter]MDP9904900.1 N-succinyldiaminopimelate aminotransferase [Arthrobacter bambusae]MDQ0129716.1 N-succinyldiaminopimelate aminotransferase [Arthrobacter bambusae]MDQ0181096.1 N-succinyldiaminopimelate aminotransferase [Arthrobacter bambusae]MDQ0242218.1 N-succinyldiaminopimelate aminotransferase [Arthrobacter bambusae]GAP57904.1 probable N-succinyldiaminopimelate aminotransferase DapC [Arthrobacter